MESHLFVEENDDSGECSWSFALFRLICQIDCFIASTDPANGIAIRDVFSRAWKHTTPIHPPHRSPRPRSVLRPKMERYTHGIKRNALKSHLDLRERNVRGGPPC